MSKFSKIRLSITAKLLLLFLSVIIISIVVFGEISYKEASTGMTESVYNQIDATTMDVVHQIEAINQRHFQMLHSLAEITAMKDESHSMWKRSELFVVSFDVGGRTKDFYVSRDVFGSLEEGDEGILKYSGNEFIDFDGKKNGFTSSVL